MKRRLKENLTSEDYPQFNLAKLRGEQPLQVNLETMKDFFLGFYLVPNFKLIWRPYLLFMLLILNLTLYLKLCTILHSRVVPSVEAHHLVNGPDT